MPRENLKWWPYKNESSDAERGADLRVAVMKIFKGTGPAGLPCAARDDGATENLEDYDRPDNAAAQRNGST